jgi:WD40 repeat protein
VGFSNDNKYIVSGSLDTSVRIWSVENGEEMMKLEGHTGFVTSVGFSNDNKYIVSTSSYEFTHRVWNVSDGTCLYNGPFDQPLPNEYASLFTSSGKSTIYMSSFSSNGSTVGIETGTKAKISQSGTVAYKVEGSLVHIFVKQ